MNKIKWNDSYSVKNQVIDDQHKEWIAIFNRLDEAMLSPNTKGLEAITIDSLKAMQDYAEYHFKFEEKYLREIGFPELSEHRRLHRDFANQIYQYNREINDGKLIMNTAIIKIIKNWLVHHILEEDKKYSFYATIKK